MHRAHLDRLTAQIAAGGGVGTLILTGGEYRLLGGLRASLALALLAVVGTTVAYYLLVLPEYPPPWLGGSVLAGALAVTLLSSVLVPPGTIVPPPLWPVGVAAATAAGLRAGPAKGLLAGAASGAIPIVSVSLSASAPSVELSALYTALLLASVAPPVLAGVIASACSMVEDAEEPRP